MIVPEPPISDDEAEYFFLMARSKRNVVSVEWVTPAELAENIYDDLEAIR